MRAQFKILFSVVGLAMVVGSVGCGSKLGGNYVLTQSGGALTSYSTNSAACSQIQLAITDNSNQVSANGQNACFNESLSGVDNGNGTMTVTLIQTPIPQSGYTSYSTPYTYTGTLTVSGNAVSGTLTSSYGTLVIQGTKN